jgi:hypothetical protein
MRDVVSRIEQFKTDMPTEATTEERLATAGVAMLDWTLSSERMGMMRLAVAEAQRFPDLASRLGSWARWRNPANSGRYQPSSRITSQQPRDSSLTWSSSPS